MTKFFNLQLYELFDIRSFRTKKKRPFFELSSPFFVFQDLQFPTTVFKYAQVVYMSAGVKWRISRGA